MNVFIKLMILQTDTVFLKFLQRSYQIRMSNPFFMTGEVCASFSHQATMIKLCVSYRQDHPMCAMLAHYMPRYIKLH